MLCEGRWIVLAIKEVLVWVFDLGAVLPTFSLVFYSTVNSDPLSHFSFNSPENPSAFPSVSSLPFFFFSYVNKSW